MAMMKHQKKKSEKQKGSKENGDSVADTKMQRKPKRRKKTKQI